MSSHTRQNTIRDVSITGNRTNKKKIIKRTVIFAVPWNKNGERRKENLSARVYSEYLKIKVLITNHQLRYIWIVLRIRYTGFVAIAGCAQTIPFTRKRMPQCCSWLFFFFFSLRKPYAYWLWYIHICSGWICPWFMK